MGTTVPVSFLQEALVILVLKQVSQFRCFGKWVKMLCLPDTTWAQGSEGNSWEDLEVSRCSGTLSSTRPCLNSCSQSGTSCNWSLCNSSLRSYLFGFSISAGPCDRFPCASTLVVSLLTVAGCSVGVTVSCDEDVGEVGEDEVEELVDRPGMTNGTWFDVSQLNFLPFFDEMWFLTTGPMVSIPVIFAGFSKWKNCHCIFKKHYLYE